MGILFTIVVLLQIVSIVLGAGEYKNPVIQGNFEAADPGVILAGSTYYVATTGGDAGGTFAIRSSVDLVNWTQVGHIFPNGQLPSWYLNSPLVIVNNGAGAPEIHYIGGKYIAYFAMRDTTGLLCVGAAFSTTPVGPFKDLGQPLVRTPGMGSIDPTAFYNDQDNHWYLYYKSDGNAIGQPTPIWAQQLSDDGLSLVGNRTFLFQNSLSWEGSLVEAPWVIANGGYYYVFYSANGYASPTYAIGVARSKTPLGPFEKCPGHCSVVQLKNSTQFAFFYAGWFANAIGQGYRMDFLDVLNWDSSAWPVPFTPSTTPQPIP